MILIDAIISSQWQVAVILSDKLEKYTLIYSLLKCRVQLLIAVCVIRYKQQTNCTVELSYGKATDKVCLVGIQVFGEYRFCESIIWSLQHFYWRNLLQTDNIGRLTSIVCAWLCQIRTRSAPRTRRKSEMSSSRHATPSCGSFRRTDRPPSVACRYVVKRDNCSMPCV